MTDSSRNDGSSALETARKETEKIKLDIKTWERGFQIEFGRTPSSSDIKQRDKIHALYKQYAEAKKKVQLLESGGSVSQQQFAKPDTPQKPASSGSGVQSPTRRTLRSQSRPAVEEERGATSDDDVPEDDGMFGDDTLFSRMFAPAKASLSPVSPATRARAALFPLIKTEPTESSTDIQQSAAQTESSGTAQAASASDPRESESSRPPGPSFFPFMLGEMLQTEAPAASSNRDRPAASVPSPSQPQRSSSLMFEYDNSGSDDVSSIMGRSSLASSRAELQHSISRASSGHLGGEPDSVSEPVHLEPGSQSQQHYSDEDMMDIDESSDAASLHRQSNETQRHSTIQRIGAKLKKHSESKKVDSKKENRSREGSDDDSKGSDAGSDQGGFTPAIPWRGGDDDDDDLFDTSRQKAKRKRDTANPDLESPSKRVKIRHQQKQGSGAEATAKSTPRQNFVKMKGAPSVSSSSRRGAASNAKKVAAKAASASPFDDGSSVAVNITEDNWDYDVPDQVLSEIHQQMSVSSQDPSAPKVPTSESHLRACLQEIWGYKEFREGQLETIQRILTLQSSLLMVPTGGGKSLCYQLPAHLLAEPGAITLVISPLISLMIDQHQKLPKQIRGVVLGSHQSSSDTTAAEKALATPGAVQVLFISPEKLTSKRFLLLLSSLKLRINFVCVDEAHCLSEWSHNFRPSYLTMCRIIKEVLQVKCVLALTATATKKTAKSICDSLGIEDSPEAVIRCSPLRSNLRLSIHRTDTTDRVGLLVKFLKDLHLKDKDCCIVYVQQQQRAENVAYELDSQGFSAMAYHAGMKPEQRRHVQEKFSRGLVRIVVATIAFGMGIDNPHVRSVIHLTLPKSIENYVQEIGRAGRDGKEARCHLITSEDDAVALRSYAHADTQDRAQVKQLLVEIFSQQRQGRATKRATKHLSVLLPVDTIEERLDMKSGVITTVLAWLEIRGLIKMLPLIHSTVEIKFFSATLEKLRRRSNLMDAVSKLGKHATKKGVVSCSLQQLSEELNTEVSDVLLQLDQLAASSGDDDTPGIQFSTKDPAFHVKVLQHPAIDSLIDDVTNRMVEMETAAVKKIDAIWNMVEKATASTDPATQEKAASSIVVSYFNEDSDAAKAPAPASKASSGLQLLSVDVRAFMSKCGEQVKTPRQIARIFHGIPSPQFPAQVWCSNGLWGKRRQFNFNDIMNVARQVIMSNHTIPKLPGKAASAASSASASSAAAPAAPESSKEVVEEEEMPKAAPPAPEIMKTPTKRPNPESVRSPRRSLTQPSPSKSNK